MLRFDGNPTVDSRNPQAYAAYAARLDVLVPGWCWQHQRDMSGELVDEARARRRAVIREAISVEWLRRMAEQVADSPDGHIDALTDAVVDRLSVELAGGRS